MTIIKYSEKAAALKDCEIKDFCAKVLLGVENNEPEFEYSNMLALNYLRGLLNTSHRHLQDKIIWMVEKEVVHFNSDMRSEEIWDLIPDHWDEALEMLL